MMIKVKTSLCICKISKNGHQMSCECKANYSSYVSSYLSYDTKMWCHYNSKAGGFSFKINVGHMKIVIQGGFCV